MFCIKTHRKEGDVLVAACDKDILGKTIRHGELELEVKKTFYHEEECGVEELIAALKEATVANLMGNRVVDAAIEHGFVDEDNVRDINGIKHAQIVLVEP